MHELVQYHPLYWEDNWTKKLQYFSGLCCNLNQLQSIMVEDFVISSGSKKILLDIYLSLY